MSLYQRKKKRTGLKIFILILIIISFLIIISYYFFIPSSQINLLINSNNYLQKDIQQVETKPNKIEELPQWLKLI